MSDWSDRSLQRRILRGNIERYEPTWSTQQVERAVDVADTAWQRQSMGNGAAAHIGIDTIKMQDRQRTS